MIKVVTHLLSILGLGVNACILSHGHFTNKLTEIMGGNFEVSPLYKTDSSLAYKIVNKENAREKFTLVYNVTNNRVTNMQIMLDE